MQLLREIITDLPDGEVEQICVGSHWTAVVVNLDGERRCGLASNPTRSTRLDAPHETLLADLEKQPARSLCDLVGEKKPLLPSVGLAAINALLPRKPDDWVERNAGDVIAQKGQGKRVVLVGHFPSVPELRQQVGRLDVLELNPRDGDFHASEAPHLIPEADVVAITSMAFVNGTMEGLLELCSPNAFVIVLGPSTPLSPLLFSKGIDMLCGSIVDRIDPVITSVAAGASFQQFKSDGVQLVTIER
jgi:uncharacterized protein (DUF4213/DUF364 family)